MMLSRLIWVMLMLVAVTSLDVPVSMLFAAGLYSCLCLCDVAFKGIMLNDARKRAHEKTLARRRADRVVIDHEWEEEKRDSRIRD